EGAPGGPGLALPAGPLGLAGRRNKALRDAVIAPALAGRRPPILGYVTLVPAAANAVVFGSRRDQQVILPGRQMTGDAGEKARPAGAAVELNFRREMRQREPDKTDKPAP